jgi:hypothetical protein
MNALKSTTILALLVCLQAHAQQAPAQLTPQTQQALKGLEADPTYKALSPDEQKQVRDYFIENGDELFRPVEPRGRGPQLTTAAPIAPAKKRDCIPVPVTKPNWLQRRAQRILDAAQKQADKAAAPVVKSVGDPTITTLPSAADIAKAVTEPCPATPTKKQ